MTAERTDPDQHKHLTVGPYRLDFRHETGQWPIVLTKRIKGVRQSVEVTRTHRTLALLRDLRLPRDEGVTDLAKDVTLVGIGMAYCSPEDTFDKEAGRQMALYKLLANLPKEPRAAQMPVRNLGRALITVYCERPGAVPWVIVDGHLDYEWLRLAREVKAREKDVHAQAIDLLIRAEEAVRAKLALKA